MNWTYSLTLISLVTLSCALVQFLITEIFKDSPKEFHWEELASIIAMIGTLVLSSIIIYKFA